MPMKDKLTANLKTLLAAYQAAPKSLAVATISKRAAGYAAFFDSIDDPTCNFGVVTYDRVWQWMSDHWPDGAEWPADLWRPEPAKDQGSAAA
jgi:hypothetical protein